MTLMEILIAIAIIMVLSALTYGTFNTIGATKAIDTNTQQALLELQKARSLALASKNETQFGVHFATSTITLFEGPSYASSATTTPTSLNSAVTITSIALTGGGSDVIFDRLTGKTSQSGTVTLTVTGKLTQSKTVKIYATGISEVQ